jgi:hypothetical protein
MRAAIRDYRPEDLADGRDAVASDDEPSIPGAGHRLASQAIVA